MDKAMTKFYAEDIFGVYQTVRDARKGVKGQVVVRIERPASKDEPRPVVRSHWINVPESGKQGQLSREDVFDAEVLWSGNIGSQPDYKKLNSLLLFGDGTAAAEDAKVFAANLKKACDKYSKAKSAANIQQQKSAKYDAMEEELARVRKEKEDLAARCSAMQQIQQDLPPVQPQHAEGDDQPPPHAVFVSERRLPDAAPEEEQGGLHSSSVMGPGTQALLDAAPEHQQGGLHSPAGSGTADDIHPRPLFGAPSEHSAFPSRLAAAGTEFSTTELKIGSSSEPNAPPQAVVIMGGTTHAIDPSLPLGAPQPMKPRGPYSEDSCPVCYEEYRHDAEVYELSPCRHELCHVC